MVELQDTHAPVVEWSRAGGSREEFDAAAGNLMRVALAGSPAIIGAGAPPPPSYPCEYDGVAASGAGGGREPGGAVPGAAHHGAMGLLLHSAETMRETSASYLRARDEIRRTPPGERRLARGQRAERNMSARNVLAYHVPGQARGGAPVGELRRPQRQLIPEGEIDEQGLESEFAQ